MKPSDPEKYRTPRIWLLALVVLGVAVVCFIATRPDAPSPTRLVVAAPPAPIPVAAPPASVTTTTPVTMVMNDGIPTRGDPDEPTDEGPRHPHPITPAHERIFHENNLIGSLNGAMDVKDAAGIRRLLAQYREEYPEDPHDLQTGYEIIADCLEHPGPASASVARQYYETETASTLRRYVRRHCLEAAP